MAGNDDLCKLFQDLRNDDGGYVVADDGRGNDDGHCCNDMMLRLLMLQLSMIMMVRRGECEGGEEEEGEEARGMPS